MRNYTPLEYLKIDISNRFGNDKLPFDDRIAWFDFNEKDLSNLIGLADNPYGYQAGLIAYNEAMQGKPIGYLVEVDAAASGSAIMSVLMGCETGCRNTGVIGDKRMDVYGVHTDEMNKLLDTDIHVERKHAKKALMTCLYGSEAKPKELFGKDTPELDAFYEAAETVLPGAIALRNILCYDAWQSYELSHDWTMFDGFDCHIPVIGKYKSKIEVDELDHLTFNMIYEDNVGTEKGISLAANVVHACDSSILREVVRRCNYDKDKLIQVKEIIENNTDWISYPTKRMDKLYHDYNFISLRGVEFISKESVYNFTEEYAMELLALIDSILEQPSFELVTIHDAYLCHPNYVNTVRYHMINVMAELAEGNIINTILKQITGQDFNLNSHNYKLGDLIRESNYIIS